MPTYVHLITLTDDGHRTFIDGPEPAPVETAERFGGEILADYLTLGSYDIVSVSSFPDAEAAAAFSLAMERGGQFRSETMRAFDVPEFVEIREAVREAES